MLTQEQKAISKFYETFGNKIKGHLVDIEDGPLVYTFCEYRYMPIRIHTAITSDNPVEN